MHKPEIKNNEKERLQELESFSILDTLEEEDYDFLTRMASQVCGTKIALISFVDKNRQWFKSHHGLEMRETPREYAFSAHAINTPKDIFLVEDSKQDVRFQDNPLVVGEPNMIFYAGVPLVTESGFSLGTLCAIDDQPKTLTKEQIDLLKALAKQVMNLLESRKTSMGLAEQNKQLESFFELNQDLLLIADIDGICIKVNHEWIDLFGYSFEELNGVKISDFVHSDGKFIYAIAKDITGILDERRLFGELSSRNEAIMASLNTNTIVSITDVAGKIIYANTVFCQISGYKEEQLIGKSHNVINSSYHPKEFWIDMWKTITSGTAWRDEVCNKAKDGTLYWVDTVIHPILDEQGKIYQYIAIRHLTTERKEAEKQLIKIKGQLLQAGKMARIGSWEVDLIHNVVDWSAVTKEILEVPSDFTPSLEKGISFYKEGESRDKITKVINKAIESGDSFDVELETITAKGKEKWVRAIGITEFIQGRCVRLYGTFQDIDEQVRNKEALLREKQKTQNVIEGTRAGAWEWNVQTGQTVFDERWAEIVGYSLKELEPINIETWKRLVHPEDFIKSEQILNAHFNKETDHHEVEVRMKHKDGRWVWVYGRGKVFSWTKDGKPLMMFGTNQDINLKKEQSNRQEMFIEQAPSAIAMFDTEIRYLAASQKWREDYQLKTNVVGRSHYEIFPDIGAEWKEIHQKCLAGATIKKDEDRFERDNGNVQWLKWEVKPWYNNFGKVGGLLMFTEDITAKKKTEEKLIVSERAFRGNFEYAGIGMALVSMKGEWLRVNRRLCSILGYTENELMQLTFQDITHPDDLENDLSLLRKLIKGKSTHYQMEKRYFHKNGSIVYVILSVSMVRDVEGNIVHFISQILDISARKEAEFKLKETLVKKQAILDASTEVAIIGTNLEGVIKTFNKGAENLLGYKAKEMVGIETPAVFHSFSEMEERGKELSDELGKEIKGFDVFTTIAKLKGGEAREWTYISKNGLEFPVLLNVTASRSGEEITGFLGLATDISSIKKAEEELKLVLNLTKNQNERLKNFAHIVSHNLRSHSGNLTALLDYLFRERPELKELESTKMIQFAAENLKETITHLSEVALLNTSELKQLESVNLAETIEKAIHNIAALAKKANVSVLNEVKENATILAIPAYLDSIVLNFLTNAIKYQSKNTNSFVKLFVEKQKEFMVLHVEDNGLGIDLEKHAKKLFGMYKTFHHHEDARGVGLFITKNQVEAMGGFIEVESKVDVGTTFKINFKYEEN